MMCHDPRISNDRSDKRATTNAALMMAEGRIRNGLTPDRIDWDEIATGADICDLPPLDLDKPPFTRS